MNFIMGKMDAYNSLYLVNKSYDRLFLCVLLDFLHLDTHQWTYLDFKNLINKFSESTIAKSSSFSSPNLKL